MSDFLAAIGLFFAIEGILFAAFPLGTQTRDGCSPRHAGQPLAAHGPRFGDRGRRHRLAGTTLIRRPRGG